MQGLVYTMMAAAAFVIFVPLFVSLSKYTGTLAFLTFLLCVFVLVGGLITFTAGGLVGMSIAPIVLGVTWLGAMICGCASFLAERAKRQSDDATYRLLFNEAEKLAPPDSLKANNRNR